VTGSVAAARHKHIPEIFKTAPRHVLERLWDGLRLGDGWTQERAERKPFTMYLTTSAELADDVQMLLVLLGHRANIHRRVLKNPKHRDHYLVSELASSTIQLKTKRAGRMVSNVSRADYDGCIAQPWPMARSYAGAMGKCL
jgi:hypothetical protein